jgi:ATP-binding cassette subfamily B protein
VIALCVPLLLQVAGGPIATGETGAIVWGAVAITVLALGEALMVWLRRSSCSNRRRRSSTTCARALLRLQRLPVAFHDRWQSGQLLSRMMQDIGLIRRWLAFGLVLLVVNLLTIVVGMALLFRWHWALGTIFLIVCVPLWYAGFRFEKTLRRARAPQPGPGRRPRDERRGERARHPRAEGVRARQARPRKFARQAEFRETELSKARRSAGSGSGSCSARDRVRAVPRRRHLLIARAR